jgi:hypothetical protein
VAWRCATPALAGTPHVRVSRDGGRTYPARHARPLPADPPGQPCTVPVYNPAPATGQLLALDFDLGRVSAAADPSAEVAAQTVAAAALVTRCGGRVIADIAPSGGRHLYILFAAPLPWRQLRDLARALALRFPAIDPAPMCSLGGQISPPGARHKSGGWRTLTTPPADTLAAVTRPNGPEVWDGLLSDLTAELRHLEQPGSPGPAEAELDAAGVPWVPCLGGRARLPAELEHAARTGASGGRGRSETRMAILASAASRGWQLTDVQAAVSTGAWTGLGVLYERRSEPGRMARLLPLEWRKTIAFVTQEKNLRSWHTSDNTSRPPTGASGGDEFRLIRSWLTAVLVALEDPVRIRDWGRRAIAVRLVLLALGQAAMVSGSAVTEFGCRNLALHCTLSHRTVARILRQLAAEPDPLIDLVSRRQLARADRYQLRIPGRYADSVRWRRLQAGRVEAAHPVFLVLGGAAALIYQALGGDRARGAEVARTARLSSSATSAALRLLAEYGLASRGSGGWRRGDARLDDVAEATGAAEIHRERAERYKKDRESWRIRLRAYQGARHVPVNERDGWYSLDDPDEYDFMTCRWPVLPRDVIRGPPAADRVGRASA